MQNGTTLKTSDVIFRDDLYPRINKSPETVQQYAETIDVLPPIEINQHNELIDGWHRWTAHKKKSVLEIAAVITETRNESHFLELAIERNAKFGLQLSNSDKKSMARRIYHITPDKERAQKKRSLAAILSVSERTISDWLSRIDKDSKEARDQKIRDMWMACYTQQEIADSVGSSEQPVKDVIADISADLRKNLKPAAEHLTDFDPPLYNVWKFKEKSAGLNHFGNTEVTIVDRLLYLYTSPMDIVIDPFAGIGSTVDMCKKRSRRYWVSDRKVEPELEGKVRQWDLIDGLPSLPRWKDVALVYLDPPYWWQAKNRYSKDSDDFANMPLERFHSELIKIIRLFARKLDKAHVALIIQPTQWNAPKKQFVDHMAEMIRQIKLPIVQRFQCPYESQQATAQMVDWAKDNRECLSLSRELIVWRVV